MKKPILPLLVPVLGILVFCLFANLECNDDSKQDDPTPEPEDKCGPLKTLEKAWLNASLSPATYYNYVENGWAVYTYSVPSVDDVCAHKHVSILFFITVKDGYGADVLYEAEVMYGILYTYPVKTWEGYQGSYMGTANFGMSFLYGDDPGYFFPLMTVKVRDQGDPNANYGFFLEAIEAIHIEYKYYKWKDNSGG